MTAPQPARPRPPAVDLACTLLWVLVVAGFAVCVMVVVRRDDLGAVWSPVQVGDSTVQPVEFVPVILVLYAVTAVLAATLIALFRTAHEWARLSLGAITIGIFLVTVGTVRTDPPLLVDWSAVGAALLSAITLVFLGHPQSRRWTRSIGRRSSVPVRDDAASAAVAAPADAGSGSGSDSD